MRDRAVVIKIIASFVFSGLLIAPASPVAADAAFAWAAFYSAGGDLPDQATKIFIDGEDNIYVTGLAGFFCGQSDYVTIKYDISGVQQWTAHYAGPDLGDDVPLDLEVDPSSVIYMSPDIPTTMLGRTGRQSNTTLTEVKFGFAVLTDKCIIIRPEHWWSITPAMSL